MMFVRCIFIFATNKVLIYNGNLKYSSLDYWSFIYLYIDCSCILVVYCFVVLQFWLYILLLLFINAHRSVEAKPTYFLQLCMYDLRANFSLVREYFVE